MFGAILFDNGVGLTRSTLTELEPRDGGWVFPGDDRVLQEAGMYKYVADQEKAYGGHWLEPGASLLYVATSAEQVRHFLTGVDMAATFYVERLERLLRPSAN